MGQKEVVGGAVDFFILFNFFTNKKIKTKVEKLYNV